MAGIANATLTTIGTATYQGEDYNLIWDDDNNGNSLIWLDYTNATPRSEAELANRFLQNWATNLDYDLTYNINASYNVIWKDIAWRLGRTVDGKSIKGFEGDPDSDGHYNYTHGYNLANSEMGHLFYTELGNKGYQNTDGTWNTDTIEFIASPDIIPQGPNFLQNTGDFDNLKASWYWSDTKYSESTGRHRAWYFNMFNGQQGWDGNFGGYGMAVRAGQVSATNPVPEPSTLLLMGVGLLGLAGYSRKRFSKKS